MLKYLSYSGHKTFETNPVEYFLKYFCNAPRMAQTDPMAVGSAFDAFIKAELYRCLVNGGDPRMTKEALFEMQVEPAARDKGRIAGEDIYKRYVELGGLKDLLAAMDGCIGEPNFELEITGVIEGVTLLGKPDVHYINRKGKRVIHDFKVMGYYSNTPPGPKTGYVKIKPGGLAHKDCIFADHAGHRINAARPMNLSAKDWAEQLSIYAWILGEPRGGDYILTIDQICCDRVKGHKLVQHASLVQPEFQEDYFRRIKRNWTAINDGHFFLNMTYEDNLAQCETLRLTAAKPVSALFRSMT